MTEQETFKCRYCKHSHKLSQLAAALSNQREISTALDNIEAYEKRLADLILREDLEPERRKYKEEKWNQKLKDYNQIIKQYSEVLVCNFCWNKGKQAANIDKQDADGGYFTCASCLNERQGRKYGLHIENLKHKGIDPRKWSIVCHECYYNEVIPADFICPRTSEGRSDWDLTLPKYDCLCPPPDNYIYKTIEGETVREIIKGQSDTKPSKWKPAQPSQPE